MAANIWNEYMFKQLNGVTVLDSANLCMINSDPDEPWVSLETPHGTWTTGYEKYEYFCRETCGDGVLLNYGLQSQNHGCDDGNNISGDGCNSNWFVEDGSKCTQLASEKSYCVPACGDGNSNYPIS
jgi:cysteine-rich repeat protein